MLANFLGQISNVTVKYTPHFWVFCINLVQLNVISHKPLEDNILK